MSTPFKSFGALQGRLELNAAFVAQCAQMAARHFEQALAEEFSGDSVEDLLKPADFPTTETWFPTEAVRALGFERAPGAQEQILATADVDTHVDDIHGPVLLLTLHNDGVKVKQGKFSHVPQVGDWLLLDDRKPHSAVGGKRSTSLLVWSVPLRALG